MGQLKKSEGERRIAGGTGGGCNCRSRLGSFDPSAGEEGGRGEVVAICVDSLDEEVKQVSPLRPAGMKGGLHTLNLATACLRLGAEADAAMEGKGYL